MKKAVSFIISLIVIILLIAAGGIAYLYNQAQPVSKNDAGLEARIEIYYGASVKSVGAELKSKNLIKNETLFYVAARKPAMLKYLCPDSETPENFVLKSGIYYISPAMNLAEVLELLSSGRQEYVSVSIPEGYTITKIGQLLEDKDVCSLDDFKAVCHDASFLSKNKITLESAEGFLFPDTYFFIPNSDAEQIASAMISNFFEKIGSLAKTDDFSDDELNDIVILASIVEREYRVADEAPLIASVFKNRIRQNIGLYSCATVEYILTEIQGKPHPKRILIEDTKIDSPYNTYKWAGLPPGPISNPGLTALNAVINTPKTSYYFFQVKDAEKGTHVFTSTFDEHIENHNLTTK